MQYSVKRTTGNRWKIMRGRGRKATQVRWTNHATFRTKKLADIVAYWLRRG